MNYIFDDNLGAWKCDALILGNNIEVTLIGINLDPTLTKESALNLVTHIVTSNIREIESVTSSFFEYYNENWADEEDGYPSLSISEFQSNLTVKGINLNIEDIGKYMINIYYDDSLMFGGHCVEVTINQAGELDGTVYG